MAEKNYGEYPDDVQNFLKRLETSLEIGDEENAMQLAKQLAKWRIKCNIEIRQNYAENNTGSNFSRSRALDEYFGGWKCPACTFINMRDRPGCEMCSQSRPSDSEESGGSDGDDPLIINRQHNGLFQDVEAILRRNSSSILDELLKLDSEPIILNDEIFDCPICLVEIELGKGIKVRECLHSVCQECIKEHISNSDKAHVDCPCEGCEYNLPQNCPSQSQFSLQLVSPDMYEKYQQRSLKAAECSNPNSFHCKTTNCNGWCVCEDDANEFLCPVCKMINCITCRAIHEEVTCLQYQEQLKHDAQFNEEARQTQQALENMIKTGEAINCPNCQVVIMKKGGCDWIQCTCRFEICWVTKGPRWGPGGRNDTSGGCRCRVINGQLCSPDCQNCH